MDLKDTGGFTISWSFITMLERVKMSMSHVARLIGKFSRGGRRAKFLPPTQIGEGTANVFAHPAENAHFKEFRILIS